MKTFKKFQEACWTGYTAKGMKKKGNRMVPNCVPEESELKESHKVGDSVTVNSKFFGKQKGKVVKVDNQSVHVQRDGKKYSEKYPHDSVIKEDGVGGIAVSGPTNVTGPQSGTDPVSATAVDMKKKKRYAMISRKAPN
jgi:hypothetical protein